MDNDIAYFTIDRPVLAEFKEKGSRFLAYGFPVETVLECRERLSEIRTLHPKATHHCFAYRLGLDANNYRCVDDGEPSNTAGRPILGQIDRRQLTNVMVIVVRYFGGTLLGVPGLINAYKSVASFALQMTAPVQKIIEEQVDIEFDYTQLNNVMLLVKQAQARIIEQELQLFCRMSVMVPKTTATDLIARFADLKGVELREKIK